MATLQPRVLFVDDEPELRDLAKRQLEGQGCVVDVASDGLEAMGLLARVDPDVVVTDLQMPGADGLALWQFIREHPAYSLIPVVVLTGLPADDRKVIRARSLPRTDVLAKTDIRVLGDLVAALARRGELRGHRPSMWRRRSRAAMPSRDVGRG